MVKKNTDYLKFIIIALVTLVVSETIYAQDVVPRIATVEHNDGERPCLVLNLDPEPKPLKKAWKSFLKDKYDFKLKGIGFLSNKDLLYAENLVIAEISAKRMDFYTKIVEDEVGSEMKVFASFGYDIYVDQIETPEEFKVINKMVEAFLASYLPEYYKNEVKATKKKVKKLTKEVEGLEKDISDHKEDIEDHKEKIEDLTKEVEEKEFKLGTASTKLEERKKKLKRISSKL